MQQPDRPSPQSQSFSRSYGSNLPTSLTYIVLSPEAVHLGDLLRISVRTGTNITPSPSDFQGPTRVHRTPQEPRCFTGTWSLSPGKPIPGIGDPYKEKRTLPGTRADVSEFVCVAALGPEGPISVSRFGNINPIPFRYMRASHTVRVEIAPGSERTSPIA